MHMFKAMIVATAVMTVSAVALADQPGADWMSKGDVMKKMEGQGYSAIVMEADDGHWEGEAVKNGTIVEFHADAHTGAVTKSKPKTED
jgi:hypothetical protein